MGYSKEQVEAIALMIAECAMEAMKVSDHMDGITLFREMPDEAKVKVFLTGMLIGTARLFQGVVRDDTANAEAHYMEAARIGYRIATITGKKPGPLADQMVAAFKRFGALW